MNIPISTNWDQLAGYGIATLLGAQSLMSATKGVKQVLISVWGSPTLTERITDSKSKNILSSLKNICIGPDSLSCRVSNLGKGLENLALSAICATISYIVFTKGIERPKQDPLTEEEKDAWDRVSDGFKGLIDEAQATSHQEKERTRAFSDFPVDPADYCTRYLSNINLHINLFNPEQKREIYDCLTDIILNNYFSKKYFKPGFLALTGQTLKAQEQLEFKSSSTGLTTTKKPLTDNQIKTLKIHFLDTTPKQRFKVALADKKIFSRFEDLKNITMDYFKRYTDSEMKYPLGPFEIDLEQICKEKSHKSLPFEIKSLSVQCQEYDAAKKRVDLIAQYEEALNHINPAPKATNAKDEVYDPILDQISKLPLNPKDSGLSNAQFEAFKVLHNQYRAKK